MSMLGKALNLLKKTSSLIPYQLYKLLIQWLRGFHKLKRIHGKALLNPTWLIPVLSCHPFFISEIINCSSCILGTCLKRLPMTQRMQRGRLALKQTSGYTRSAGFAGHWMILDEHVLWKKYTVVASETSETSEMIIHLPFSWLPNESCNGWSSHIGWYNPTDQPTGIAFLLHLRSFCGWELMAFGHRTWKFLFVWVKESNFGDIWPTRSCLIEFVLESKFP